MKCPNCGKETDETLEYCRFCGARLKAAEAEKAEKRGGNRIRKVAKASGVVALVAIIILAVFFSSAMFVNVPVGYTLILVDPITKSVGGPILGPTWYIKAPWVQGVLIYYAVDSLGMGVTETYKTADYPAVTSFSKDQLEMRVDIVIRWKIVPEKLVDLYRNYPSLEWKDTIASLVRQTIRFVTANFTAVETVEKRAFIGSEMQNEILKVLQAEPSLVGAISSVELDLRNIALPESYTAAIEAKLVAEQQKMQADFERQRILILANATAQEAIIKAQGEATSKIILANGTKQAIQMAIQAAGVTNSTTIAELYLWVEALKVVSPNVDILIIATGQTGVPLIFQISSNSTGP